MQADQMKRFDITIHKLTYKTKVKEKDSKLTTDRILLDSITAEAKHGELLAIFGPSGSGKTTLLDALAGRIDKKSLSGSILVNGKPMDRKFKRQSGYVMQEDALFPLLTVRETLLYSSRLRLPSQITLQEKKDRVHLVLEQLGLTMCADTRIGDDKTRGISGGERRRVSIGVDVIHDPAVLLLDEPTSGLDSASALQVMELLSVMAKQHGRTVILTIHQPGYEILETIHKCLMLVQGNVIFHGRPNDMVNYFEDLGYSMPDNITSVEYFLKVVSECREDLQKLVNYYHDKNQRDCDQDSEIEFSQGESLHPYATSFASQTMVLAERNLRIICRTKELFQSRIAMLILGAVVMGSLFLRCKVDSVGLRQRQSFIGFSLSFLLFTSSQTLPLMAFERHIFIRETSRGAYRTSAYVVASSLVILPFLLVLAASFSIISYPMVGFALTPAPVLFYLLVYFLVLTMAASFVTCIAGIIPDIVMANGILQTVLSFFFLFSGYFIQRNAIPVYWVWMHYISLHKYPYEALLKNELKQYPSAHWVDGTNATTDDVLSTLSLENVHQWQNVMIMLAFTVVYRLIFYFHLLWMRQHTRR